MQTIKTRVLPATHTKPTRIKATHGGKMASVTISADGDYETRTHAHVEAAQALMRKLNWTGIMVGGGPEDGEMVFVFVQDGGDPVAMTDGQFCAMSTIALRRTVTA